jgi:AbrB family looped-hinge helix DNA binding protein
MAQEVRVKLTTKGQVTIPKVIRRALGVRAHDSVTFVLEEGEVRLKPAAESVVAQTAGLLKPKGPRASAAKLRSLAEEAVAAEVEARS